MNKFIGFAMQKFPVFSTPGGYPVCLWIAVAAEGEGFSLSFIARKIAAGGGTKPCSFDIEAI